MAKPITLDDLMDRLVVIDENVKTEALQQPGFFLDAARYRVDMMRKRAKADAELETSKVSRAIRVRSKASQAGEKLTEAGLKERVERDVTIQGLREAADRSYEDEELSKLVLEAYRQRSSSIKILAELLMAEGRGEVMELERDEQHKRLANEARRIIKARQKEKV